VPGRTARPGTLDDDVADRLRIVAEAAGPGVDAFGAAVAPGQGAAGVDGGAVEFEAVAEAVQVGQVDAADRGDPLGEFVVVGLGRGQECGELAGGSRECGHLGAGRGEEAEQGGVLGPQVLGVGEQEPGEVAGVVTGRSPSLGPG
jgi:hypothetical protein